MWNSCLYFLWLYPHFCLQSGGGLFDTTGRYLLRVEVLTNAQFSSLNFVKMNYSSCSLETSWDNMWNSITLTSWNTSNYRDGWVWTHSCCYSISSLKYFKGLHFTILGILNFKWLTSKHLGQCGMIFWSESFTALSFMQVRYINSGSVWSGELHNWYECGGGLKPMAWWLLGINCSQF